MTEKIKEGIVLGIGIAVGLLMVQLVTDISLIIFQTVLQLVERI